LPVSLAVLLALPSVARADIFGNTYSHENIELTVPRGWELTEQRSYPGILVRGYEHRTGARLLLAVGNIEAGDTAQSYAERNQKALVKIGYRVTAVAAREGGAIVVDLATKNGKRLVRQAYFVVGASAYILTVGVKADAAKTGRPFEAFDEAMRTLKLPEPEKPAQPAEPPPAAPASQPAEGTR